MPKYYGENYFAHRRFPKSKKRRKKKRERDKNGQATHGARKHAWRTQAAWAKRRKKERLNNGDKNGQATHGARKHACFLWQAFGQSLDQPILTGLFIKIQPKSKIQNLVLTNGKSFQSFKLVEVFKQNEIQLFESV